MVQVQARIDQPVKMVKSPMYPGDVLAVLFSGRAREAGPPTVSGGRQQMKSPDTVKRYEHW